MCYDNRHQTLESYNISVSFQGFSKLSDSTQTKLLKIKKNEIRLHHKMFP